MRGALDFAKHGDAPFHLLAKAAAAQISGSIRKIGFFPPLSLGGQQAPSSTSMKTTLLALLALAFMAPSFAGAATEKKTKPAAATAGAKSRPHGDAAPATAKTKVRTKDKDKARTTAAKADKKAGAGTTTRKKTGPKPAPKPAPKPGHESAGSGKTKIKPKPAPTPPDPTPKADEPQNDDPSPESTPDEPKIFVHTSPVSLEEGVKGLDAEGRLRFQVFLDRNAFVPGKVDGQTGEFSLKAARRWISAEEGRTAAALFEAAQAMEGETTILFEVPAEALNFVGPMPATLEEKAAAKGLSYTSLAEYVAERFHTDEATLARLNPELKTGAINPGDSVRVPNVTPFKIEAPRIESSTAARLAGASIQILHEEHVLEVRRGGVLMAAFPITVGGKPEHVRTGLWKVESITANPSFMWDDEMLKNGRQGDKQYLLPPGPNNPVGVIWMALQPVSGPVAHIGIHGTSDPAHIGRNQSSGCIRLANWDVVRLARLIGPGTKVMWKSQFMPENTLIAKAP